MIINGIYYQLINILILLMQNAGPTPVIGTNGTTGAFLTSNHSIARLR